MQKTEKHCKNQCFCYHKTTKISPKTGPKTQKSASGPGHLRKCKKRCCKPKNWGQKVEKHGFFSLFACRFWTGAFTNRCLPYCFLQCFLKASVKTYQKQEVLAEKCPPPRDGLLGTMRQKAFNRNDLEREKKHSSSGYSSSSIITCCYALALHLYLSTHLLLWIKFLLPRSQ